MRPGFFAKMAFGPGHPQASTIWGWLKVDEVRGRDWFSVDGVVLNTLGFGAAR